MKTFFIATMGCKINQYESQALREAWTGRGFAEADTPGGADVILVNSCAVTDGAVRDLRQLLGGFQRDLLPSRPHLKVIVTGCAAQVMADELASMPGVDLVVPQSDKPSLLDLPFPSGLDVPPSLPNPHPNRGVQGESFPLVERGPGERQSLSPGRRRHFPEAPAYPGFAITGCTRSRPVVKVQDGCGHGCTYCIVPLTRGRSASRPAGEVLDEVRRLLDRGFREIVLSGINLRQYGRDFQDTGEPGWDFWRLLAHLDGSLAREWAGAARLRLSSLDPGQLGAGGLDTLAGCRMVCPHLHLSLQSGSPDILRRMGRGHYGPDDALRFVEGLGRVWPRFGLGADLLVGFPGETDGEFERTMALAAALPLTYAHVFPYSPRPGTPAARFPDQVPGGVKKSRAGRLRGLAAEKKRAFLAGLAALDRLEVVFDGNGGNGPIRGVSGHYADCVLSDEGADEGAGEAACPVRKLVQVRPVGLGRAGDCLLVAALPTGPEGA
jgi:tRNA A37 methylthiotransferase MiaB